MKKMKWLNNERELRLLVKRKESEGSVRARAAWRRRAGRAAGRAAVISCVAPHHEDRLHISPTAQRKRSSRSIDALC
jgi:hypothetical protein